MRAGAHPARGLVPRTVRRTGAPHSEQLPPGSVVLRGRMRRSANVAFRVSGERVSGSRRVAMWRPEACREFLLSGAQRERKHRPGPAATRGGRVHIRAVPLPEGTRAGTAIPAAVVASSQAISSSVARWAGTRSGVVWSRFATAHRNSQGDPNGAGSATNFYRAATVIRASKPSGSLPMAMMSASNFCLASSGVEKPSSTMRPGARCTPDGRLSSFLVHDGGRSFDEHARVALFVRGATGRESSGGARGVRLRRDGFTGR